MNKQLKQFWQDFCQKHNLECDTPVEAWAFGATKEFYPQAPMVCEVFEKVE